MAIIDRIGYWLNWQISNYKYFWEYDIPYLIQKFSAKNYLLK